MIFLDGKRRVAALTMPVAVALAVGAGWAGAQDGAASHPAHIHAGSCDELGDVAFPLTNVGPSGGGAEGASPTAGEAEEAAAETMGSTAAIAAVASPTTVDASLEDLLAEEHAINVHESEEKIETYIACGDLGGPVTGETLVVGLWQLNESGFFGIAVLEGAGDRTEVSVYLARGLAGGAVGETVGTPSATGDGAATDGEVAVEIVDSAFEPERVEVPVGGTVTWTNRDIAAHTATGQDPARFDSGGLGKDKSYSQTFDEPGTYEYFCEYHPYMKGTVVVE